MVMSKRKEKISAFLDNDMHRDELMSFSLSAEPEDAGTVQRYQMVGDALRGEMSNSSFVDVSQAVRSALVNENIGDTATAQKVDDLSGKSTVFNLSAWFRPVAGMAVAASVAVVMVVSLSGQETGSVAPVVASKTDPQPVVTVAVENAVTDQKASDIDQRLINQHLEFATQDALQGRLPYVRAVSFEKKK